MPYSTYIFDLDGTLLDTLTDITNAVNYSLGQMNYPGRTAGEVCSFIGNGIKMLIRRAVPTGTGEAEYEKTLALFMEYYLVHVADFSKPYDGIIEVVDELKNRGCKIAVVSNKTDRAAVAVVRQFFGNRFDMVVGKRDCFPTKPAPDSVLFVMKNLGADSADTVYIGDSEVDVQTAHSAGLPCIGVTWGNRDRAELVENGAEYVVDSPREILNV